MQCINLKIHSFWNPFIIIYSFIHVWSDNPEHEAVATKALVSDPSFELSSFESLVSPLDKVDMDAICSIASAPVHNDYSRHDVSPISASYAGGSNASATDIGASVSSNDTGASNISSAYVDINAFAVRASYAASSTSEASGSNSTSGWTSPLESSSTSRVTENSKSLASTLNNDNLSDSPMSSSSVVTQGLCWVPLVHFV